jgi:pyridinium-3,5-biscarboxylic acid mononucleotide sulfurtransferase
MDAKLDGVKQIAACESFMKGLRFRDFRVRTHGDLARIEISEKEFDRLAEKTTRDVVIQKFKDLGFTYVSVDLRGHRP